MLKKLVGHIYICTYIYILLVLQFESLFPFLSDLFEKPLHGSMYSTRGFFDETKPTFSLLFHCAFNCCQERKNHIPTNTKNPELVGFEKENGDHTSVKNLASLLFEVCWNQSRVGRI